MAKKMDRAMVVIRLPGGRILVTSDNPRVAKKGTLVGQVRVAQTAPALVVGVRAKGKPVKAHPLARFAGAADPEELAEWREEVRRRRESE